MSLWCQREALATNDLRSLQEIVAAATTLAPQLLEHIETQTDPSLTHYLLEQMIRQNMQEFISARGIDLLHCGAKELYQIFLQHGADINYMCAYYHTAGYRVSDIDLLTWMQSLGYIGINNDLIDAIHENHVPAIKACLAVGADVNFHSPKDDPIFMCSETTTLDLLVAHGYLLTQQCLDKFPRPIPYYQTCLEKQWCRQTVRITKLLSPSEPKVTVQVDALCVHLRHLSMECLSILQAIVEHTNLAITDREDTPISYWKPQTIKEPVNIYADHGDTGQPLIEFWESFFASCWLVKSASKY